MTTMQRGPVLTIGELRQLLAELPDHALIALSVGESGDAFADLRTVFVDSSRGTLVVFSPPETGAARLFEAVAADDEGLVQNLVDEGADVNARDPQSPFFDGATPLILAAEGGRVAMTSLLLKLGADVDAQSASGWTALMRACNAGEIEAARILLEAGADTTLVNDDGYTARGRVRSDNRALLDLLGKLAQEAVGSLPEEHRERACAQLHKRRAATRRRAALDARRARAADGPTPGLGDHGG